MTVNAKKDNPTLEVGGIKREIVGRGYGPHLTIDGYEVDRELLNDRNLIYEILDKLPGVIGMTKLIPPYVISYDGADKPEDMGVTGFVVISESHISIHTYPEKGYVSFDVFSCNPFDVDKAFGFIQEKFKMEKFERNLVQRGLNFPRT